MNLAGSLSRTAPPRSPAVLPTAADRAGRRGPGALLAAAGISSIGDGAFLAAAPLAAAAVTREPTWVAAVLAAEQLPWMLVAPFAGVYVDRWPKRTTMIVTDVIRAGGLGVLAVLMATGAATIPAIAACAALAVAGTVFHSAAMEAVVADVTARDGVLLNRLNGHLQSTNTAGRQLIGPPLGSWSFSLGGWLPFVGDAVSYLLSACMLATGLAREPRRDGAAQPRSKMWPALHEGLAHLLGHRLLRTMALLTAVGNFAVSMAMATFVLFATDPGGLGVTTATFGLLVTAMAAGGITGGLVAPHLIRWLGDGRTVVAGLLIPAGIWLLVAVTHDPIVAGFAVCVLWISIAPVTVVIAGVRQRHTPPSLLGRVICAYRVVGNGLAPLGALAGGVIAVYWSLRAPMVIATLVLAAAVLPAIRSLRNDPTA